MVRMERSWVEDERDTTVLLDGLRKVRTRRSPVFGKLKKVATAEGALTLIVVNSRNQTGLLSWGKVIGFHSLVRLAVVFPLFLLLGLGALFNLLEFFLLLLPIGPAPTRLFHTPKTKLQTPSHLLLFVPLAGDIKRNRTRIQSIVFTVGVRLGVSIGLRSFGPFLFKIDHNRMWDGLGKLGWELGGRDLGQLRLLGQLGLHQLRWNSAMRGVEGRRNPLRGL